MVPCSLLAENIFSVFRSPHLPLDTPRLTNQKVQLHRSHAWNDAIINQSYIAYLRAGLPLPSSCCKGEACLPRLHYKGKHRVQNGVSRGKCGPRKTEKYFRLIMNRVPEYSHLVFIIPVYLRTITLSKSLVIVQL